MPSPLLPSKDPDVFQEPEQWEDGTIEEEKHALADLTTWHCVPAVRECMPYCNNNCVEILMSQLILGNSV